MLDYEVGIHPSRIICEHNLKMFRIFMNRTGKIIMLETYVWFFFSNFKEIYTKLFIQNFVSYSKIFYQSNVPYLSVFRYLLEISDDRVVGRGPKVSYFWITYFIFTNSLFPSDFGVIKIIITSWILPCFIRI